MYIIELFFKLKNDIKEGKIKNPFKKKETVLNNETSEECSHLFVPIDSTGRILACSKCGQIYKLKKGEVNPFE